MLVKPGETVWVDLGEGPTPVTVVEDRGRVGARGRSILRVRVSGDEETFEVPVDLLVPPPAKELLPPPDSVQNDDWAFVLTPSA
jgi:hypothetical protein